MRLAEEDLARPWSVRGKWGRKQVRSAIILEPRTAARVVPTSQIYDEAAIAISALGMASKSTMTSLNRVPFMPGIFCLLLGILCFCSWHLFAESAKCPLFFLSLQRQPGFKT
jgi:hypothetical protein